MLRISNIRLDLSSRLSPLLSTGEFKMEWVPISKYVSSNYIYVFLNYIYVWSNSWLGETVCKCRKTNTTRGETRTQKTWDRSPSYTCMNVWWKLFNDWQQLQHGTRGYQINIYMYIFTGSIGEGLCLTDSFVPLVSLYSCCYIQWHPMHIGQSYEYSNNDRDKHHSGIPDQSCRRRYWIFLWSETILSCHVITCRIGQTLLHVHPENE